MPILVENINIMCDFGVFRLPSELLRIEATAQSSLTRLSLCLQEDFYDCSSDEGFEQYMQPLLSISGFPRKLWAQASRSGTEPSLNNEGSDIDQERLFELPGDDTRSQSAPANLSEGAKQPLKNRLFKRPPFGKSVPGGLNTFGRVMTSGSDGSSTKSRESMERGSQGSLNVAISPSLTLGSRDVSFVSGTSNTDLGQEEEDVFDVPKQQ